MIRVPFVLPADVREAIAAHARRDRPHECCGFLIGNGRRVRAAIPMRNAAADTATRFRIDDRDHIELRRALRQLAPPQQIVGVYHSHPTSAARPSPRDLEDAHYPDWLYVVVGFAGDRTRVRGFTLDGGRMRPARLAAVGEA